VITRRIVTAQVINADLTIKPDGCPGNQWFPMMDTGAVYGVPGGEIVRAIENQISAGDERIQCCTG